MLFSAFLTRLFLCWISKKSDGAAADGKARVARKLSTGTSSQPRPSDANQLTSKGTESRTSISGNAKNAPHFMTAGGATFKENPTLELEMRGQGYPETKPTTKDRQRPGAKGEW